MANPESRSSPEPDEIDYDALLGDLAESTTVGQETKIGGEPKPENLVGEQKQPEAEPSQPDWLKLSLEERRELYEKMRQEQPEREKIPIKSEQPPERKQPETQPDKPETPETVSDFRKELEKKAEIEFQEYFTGRGITEDSFVAERAKRISEKMWDEAKATNYANLSPRDQKRFMDLRYNHMVLSGEEVDGLMVAGWDIKDIKNVKYGFLSTKIKSGLSGGEAVPEEEFDKLIAETIKQTKSEMVEEAERRAKSMFENIHKKAVDQYVKNAEYRIQQEESEKRRQEKVEADKSLEPEKRFELLNELRSKWRIAKKIDNAIKTGKRVRLENGKYLENLDDINGRLSDRIVDIAEELTGENVRGDALALSGCNPSGPENDEQRKAFREQLTKNVRAIFYEQARRVQKELKKKIVTKKKPAEEVSTENVIESVIAGQENMTAEIPETLKSFTVDTAMNFNEPLPEPQEKAKKVPLEEREKGRKKIKKRQKKAKSK